MSVLADLTDRERQDYDQAGDQDRRWFACHPGRQYRLRPAKPSEAKFLAAAATRDTRPDAKVHEHCRLRRRVLWTIPAAHPGRRPVLAGCSLASVFTDRGGHA